MVFGTLTASLVTPFAWFWAATVNANRAQLSRALPATAGLQRGDRLLILSPHPDDETLGAAGTIAQARKLGLPVRIVFMTCGDGSGSTLLYENWRDLSRHSYRDLAPMRRREALAALNKLGVAARDVVFLGFPDGGGQALWNQSFRAATPFRSPPTNVARVPYKFALVPNAPYCGEELLREISAQMKSFRPTLVISTHPTDTHQDHAAAGIFSQLALESLRLSPNVPAWTRRAQWRGFVVHHGIWPVPNGLHPQEKLCPPADLADIGLPWTQTPLDAATRAQKLSALEQYPSQLAFTPGFLRAFVRRNELFAASAPRQNALTQRDATRNSPLRDAWRASDVQTLVVSRLPNGALSMRLRTAATPSSRLRYRVSFHVLIAGQNAPQTKLATLEFAFQSRWTATWKPENGAATTFPARLQNGALSCDIAPALALKLLPRNARASAFVQASSWWNGTQLDAAPVACVRFGAS